MERDVGAQSEGVTTRDELLEMGCTEVKAKSGRRAYLLKDFIIAIECTKCAGVKFPEKFKKDAKSYKGIQSKCKKCESEYDRKRFTENPTKREKAKKYYWDNREKRKEAARVYYLANKEAYAESQRIFYIKNPNYRNKHREDNQEMYILADQRRRARKRSLPDDLTTEQLSEITASFYSTCALSGETADLHNDHVLPISIGHGGTIYGNIIPLSAELNMSKYNAHLYEWFDANHERFGLAREKFDALIEYLAEANEMTTQEYRKYTDWCFDNPRVIAEASGELVFINERKAIA